MLESDIDVEFVKPILYDLYETQKLVDAKMTIYNAFADKDEISKILVQKKYLGWSDRDVEENYKSIIKEKQMTAVGDFFADQISEENPPVDFRSPVRLKKDVDAEEKANSGIPTGGSSSGGGGGDAGGDDAGGDDTGGDDSGEEESGGEDEGPGEPSTPSFGL